MPNVDSDSQVTAADFGRWVERYNASGIHPDCRPPQLAVEQAGQCSFTVCSNLPRSLESAKLLGIKSIDLCDAEFREMDMPFANWRSPRIPVRIWSVFFRLIWALGYSANAESFKAAKERARHCANRLADLASTHGTVLFVGHGSLNWFIARCLKGMEWSCPRKPPRKYWEFGVYCYRAT